MYNLKQFQDDTITNYVTRWIVIFHELTFPIPQYELTHIFLKICSKHISNTLVIQHLPSFEEAIRMDKRIEDVNVQNGDINIKKKQEYKNNKGPFATPPQPHVNQVTLSQPIHTPNTPLGPPPTN